MRLEGGSVVIMSGRCHGPHCHNTAVIKDGFCSEVCQAKWHGQYDHQSQSVLDQFRLHGLPPGPWLQAAVEVQMPAVQAAVQAEMDRVVADTLTQVSQQQIVHTAPGSMMEDIRRAYELVRDAQPPEPVKLTQGQIDALAAGGNTTPDYVDPLSRMWGIPIELVETVEESTPYLEQRKRMQQVIRDRARSTSSFRRVYLNDVVSTGEQSAAYPQVASTSPLVAQSGVRGWLGRLLHRKRRTP